MDSKAKRTQARRLYPTSFISGLLIILLATAPTYGVQPSSNESESEARPTGATPDLNADARSDVAAMDKYEAAVAQMLNRNEFAQLDQLADSLRASKSRFGGGVWKLYIFYRGLKQPAGGYKATTDEWEKHLGRLENWAQNRQSATAWIALAEAYFEYSQKAQIEEDAIAATKQQEPDRHISMQRRHQARLALKEAEQLNTKCPHYYFVKQKIAGVPDIWLFREARKSEPGYYYYYRMQGLLLQLYPEESGDAEKFADNMAAEIGGDEGQIVYYEIAAAINGNGGIVRWPQAKFPWEKVLAGYTAEEKKYGTSLFRQNQMAYMAIQQMDTLAAKPFFNLIGDRWDSETWGTKDYFESSRNWAMSPPEFAAVLDIASSNGKTSIGQQYYQSSLGEYRQFARPVWKTCTQPLNGNLGGSFDLLYQIGGDGTIQKTLVWPETKLSSCMISGTLGAKFPAPPTASYWLRIPVPLQVNASSH